MMVNILPYQLYLEKHKQKLIENCFNSVMLENLNTPSNFCEQTLPSKIDFVMWTDEMQKEACFKAML